MKCRLTFLHIIFLKFSFTYEGAVSTGVVLLHLMLTLYVLLHSEILVSFERTPGATASVKCGECVKAIFKSI